MSQSLLHSPVPSSRCPHCQFVIDTRAWRDGLHQPEVGDLSICQGCAHILRFGRRLTLTAMTERDERRLLASDPDIRHQAQTVARRLLAHLTLA